MIERSDVTNRYLALKYSRFEMMNQGIFVGSVSDNGHIFSERKDFADINDFCVSLCENCCTPSVDEVRGKSINELKNFLTFKKKYVCLVSKHESLPVKRRIHHNRMMRLR